MLVIGHRGAAGHVDENTVASIRHAVACGVDGIEFDVRLLDGALILLHDATLERTTDGRGSYKDLDLTALRRLRTRQGHPVPLLAEALEVVADLCLVNVEVKEAGIADEVVTALDAWYRGRAADQARVLLSSFDRRTTAALAKRRGRMRIGILYDDEPFEAALRRAVDLEAWSVHLPIAQVEQHRIEAVHALGLAAYVYTVNSVPQMARCHACGVDGVFSDFPDRVRAYLRTLPIPEEADHQ
ncbi:MAG: glycerophosphodiester phosphodiesterase family protein [Gammaproteobacteria bacterium]